MKSRPGWVFSSLVAMVAVALGGCQPPLSLEAVEKAGANPIRRTDEFQAAASRGHTVVVVGNHGLIVTSRDSGAHWQRRTLDQWPSLIGVTACGEQAFAAISYEGALWLSLDNGATWRSSTLGSSARPQAITCDRSGGIWVVGESATLLSSRDYGLHWQSTTLDTQDLFLTTIQFVDGVYGYVTGEFGTVMASSDAGQTWRKLPSMPGEMYPEATYFADASHGWAVGLNGTILHTVDGAQHWTVSKVDVSSPLYGLASAGDAMYAVGGDGTVLRYDNPTWARLPGPRLTHSYIRVTLRTDTGALVVGGGGGTLVRVPLSTGGQRE